MERPNKYEYPDPQAYKKAWERYRLYMISMFEAELADATSRDEQIIARRRIRYWRNHEKILAAVKRYGVEHREECLAKDRRYSADHRRERSDTHKRYRLKHHDAILKREAEKRDKNRDLLNKRARDRYHKDVQRARALQKKWRDAHKKPNPPVVCPICGQEFVRHNGEQKYCSPACFKENRRRYANARYASRTDAQKERDRIYGREYARRDYARERSKAYSQTPAGREARKKAIKNYNHSEKREAARKRRQATETYRAERHRHDVRRRARKAESDLIAVDKGIHWKTLARRLGSMKCAMCGKECDPDGEPGIRPTVDHIVPLSRGGTHTWDNVQLLCMRCNAGKCNKLPEELNAYADDPADAAGRLTGPLIRVDFRAAVSYNV